MAQDKAQIEERIAEIEARMAAADFWTDKVKAQETIREYDDMKDALAGVGKYDKGGAILTILSGAGGDDAEDFSRILLGMYLKFASNKNWETLILHKNENDHGGYRNITIEIIGKSAYGTLKNESGVHRLVRISPFNSKKMRHTSFSLVEVIPKFSARGGPASGGEAEIPESDLRIEFSKSSGPGGQNVNKRETAVRIVHVPTDISVHADSERSQVQNKEKAMAILQGKLHRAREEADKSEKESMYISKTTDIEWGSQIRSYVLHPYKMVKDHRTDVEVRDVEKVLEEGELDEFIEAEKHL